jgi:periplasmic mercuric ion binding protein
MMTRILLIAGFLVSISLLMVGPGVYTREHVAWAVEAPDPQTFTLQIDGMTCAACVKDIRSALLKVPGVKAVEFQIKKKAFFFQDYSDARAIITCEPGKTPVNALITAVEGVSNLTSTYKASQLVKEERES